LSKFSRKTRFGNNWKKRCVKRRRFAVTVDGAGVQAKTPTVEVKLAQ
jgi:hypothetical protein